VSKRKIPAIFPDNPMYQLDNETIYTDPFGSYTGLVESKEDKPVQDADDL